MSLTVVHVSAMQPPQPQLLQLLLNRVPSLLHIPQSQKVLNFVVLFQDSLSRTYFILHDYKPPPTHPGCKWQQWNRHLFLIHTSLYAKERHAVSWAWDQKTMCVLMWAVCSCSKVHDTASLVPVVCLCCWRVRRKRRRFVLGRRSQREWQLITPNLWNSSLKRQDHTYNVSGY